MAGGAERGAHPPLPPPQAKVRVLESWLGELGEQNGVLVSAVEELEREAGQRVSLLEDRLGKMADDTRDSCLALRDHHATVGGTTSLSVFIICMFA